MAERRGARRSDRPGRLDRSDDRYSPRTRDSGRPRVTENAGSDTEERVTGVTLRGTLVDKNRSDGWRGYKSHLTDEQRRLIRWALRQRDLGHSRQRIVDALIEKGWKPSPIQYPLSKYTIGAWVATRLVNERNGKVWP